MPIYHDYHGDSKSSSISTWDQIQISLKFLLPSYQPIVCDSPFVSSLLSDPICTDFKQITTLHELQAEEHSDLQIQATSAIPEYRNSEIQSSDQNLATTRSTTFKFNQNSSSSRTDQATIHVQIHPSQSENHHSEYKIQEEATIQIAEIQHSTTNSQNTEPEFHQSDPEIQVHTQSDRKPKSSACNFKFDQYSISVSTTTTPTEASDYSGFPEITKQIDEKVKFVPYGGVTRWIEGDQQSESVMEIGNCLRSGQNGRVAIGAEDDTAAKGRIEAAALKPTAAAEAIRPPPAPTDPEPAVILEVATPYTATSMAKSSGAKVVAIVDELLLADVLKCTNADDGSAATGRQSKCATFNEGAPRMTSGGFQAPGLGRAYLIVVKPRPLLAAVLPWHREEVRTVTEQEEVAFGRSSVRGALRLATAVGGLTRRLWNSGIALRSGGRGTVLFLTPWW
ncbi:hypothetical protein PIB30_014895 [Stylosanthes scabra]|uniref:Uncharacterized protein n=1 Tax=Stylosanthes scabra TaxID=79078 RepID=A0ABU6U5S4_9FABA|nr:hypothetical protein [Stylosanthes scabra]